MTDKIVKLISRIKQSRYKLVFSICFSFMLIFPSICLSFDLFSTYNPEEYQQYCNSAAFEAKYEGADSSCWSCRIIRTLMEHLGDAATTLSGYTIDLGKNILLYGSAIWLALYFLKSLSSATAQDPSRVIDGVITFMFKFAVAYIFIGLGIDEVIKYIVNPLLDIGIDIGIRFANYGSL